MRWDAISVYPNPATDAFQLEVPMELIGVGMMVDLVDITNISHFSERIKNVELNINYEGGNFASTGDFRNDFLGIISVHPMREDAVYNLLNKTGERFETVENLLRSGIVLKKEYNGKVYFLRNLKGVKNGKNNFGSNRANN